MRHKLQFSSLSLLQCLGTAEYIRFILAEAWHIKPAEVPIVSYVDNDDLYKSLHSTTLVSDKKLRIDIASIKQTMSEENVSVCWLQSSDMLADGLTKKGADTSKLMSVIQSGRLPTKKTYQ